MELTSLSNTSVIQQILRNEVHKLPWGKFMTRKLVEKKFIEEKFPKKLSLPFKTIYGLVNGRNTETGIIILRYTKPNTNLAIYLLNWHLLCTYYVQDTALGPANQPNKQTSPSL